MEETKNNFEKKKITDLIEKSGESE